MRKSTQKHPKSTVKPEVPAKPRDDGISLEMKFPLIARNLRFFSCETDWFGDPPSRRSPWCCRRSLLVRLEENEEKSKRDGERWGRRSAGERNEEDNEKLKNIKK
jgi:hypothetical protein